MRLLSTKELQLQEFPSSNVPKYATLSHVWNDEEVIFQDMEKKGFKERNQGFLKLILLQSSDQTLFLWIPSHEPCNQGLLATSPKAFCTHYDCFDWWHVLEKVPRDQFSPYSFLRPVSRRPSMRTFDKYCRETSVETTDGTVHQASLGQNGLQISVLADFGAPGQDETARRNRIIPICFDILAVGPKYRTAILLLLEPDLVYDYIRGFIPNRRGDVRRRVCSEPGSNYLHALPDLSFKRTNITVSQLNTSACKPGSPTFFKFLSSGVTPLASDITVFKADDTVEMPPTVTEFFECSGGIAKVKHRCT
jgi:hypothetical protein